MARHDMFRWLAQKTERQGCTASTDLDGSSGDTPDLDADVVAPDGALAPGLPADVDVTSNVNSAAIAVSAVAIALSAWTSGGSTPSTDTVEDVGGAANDDVVDIPPPIAELETVTSPEQMQPEELPQSEPHSQHQADLTEDLETEVAASSDDLDGSSPSAGVEPQLLFDERRLRVVEALDKARKQPVPVCGMPVVELVGGVNGDGASFRAGYVVNVRAGGRKLSVRFEGSGSIPIFTLRLDGRYCLEGAPSRIAPRLVLDVEV